jgi:hypothetical protein
MGILESILQALKKVSFHIRSKWKSKCCKGSFCDCFSDIAVNEPELKTPDSPK